MYRITMARPGGPPYLTLYASPGLVPPAGEVAVLGGRVEWTRGGFCGPGSVRLSRPPAFRAGDWLRLYRKDELIYLGEVTGEPWAHDDPDTVNLRALAETVGRARWIGAQEQRFKPYLEFALNDAVLTPGVTVGPIPAALATLRGDTPHELLGDTFERAMPAIDGGTWGVDAQARVGVALPSAQITHRFFRQDSDTDPGDSAGYANSIRYPYTLPNGAQQWFEVQIPAEVAVRGEVWEEAQVPSPVTDAAENPLEGTAGAVTLNAQHAWNGLQTLTRAIQATPPVFDPLWAGNLSDGLPALDTGLLYGASLPLTRAEDSVLRVSFAQGANTSNPDVVAVRLWVRGVPSGAALQSRLIAGTTSAWITLTPSSTNAQGDVLYVLRPNPAELRAAIAYTFELRYDPATFTAGRTMYRLRGPVEWRLRSGLWDTHFPLSEGISAPPAQVTVEMVVAPAVDPGAVQRLTGAPASGATAAAFLEPALPAGTASYLYSAAVTLPAPLTLPSGSAVLVRGAATSLTAVTPTGDVNLTAADPEGEMKKWAWNGPGALTVTAFRVSGDPAQVGRIVTRVTSEANLIGYGLGLLRYRTQPVRRWVGRYRGATPERLRAYGRALFEGPEGDVSLDVQRVTLDIDGELIEVEAGTPMARNAGEAIAGKILELRREQRLAGGT